MPPPLRIENGEPNQESPFAGLDDARNQAISNVRTAIALWRKHNAKADSYLKKRESCTLSCRRNQFTVWARDARWDARKEWKCATAWANMLAWYCMAERGQEMIAAAKKEAEAQGWVFGDEGDGGNGGTAA